MAEPARHSITRRLADACAAIRLETLPAEVTDRARDLLLDYLGVWYRGAQADSSAAVIRAAAALSGAGRATVAGRREGLGSAWAALANGASAHALEMDDVTTKSSLHPGVAVFPAALALAEEVDASPSDALAAAVAGYEVMMRVGSALNPSSAYRRGFHPTGVAGAFGAAAAAGRILRLPADRLAHALGIAGTMASGSLEYLSGGAWTKRLNPGWAAHCGVAAARLAAEGFSGPTTAIEGPLGLLHGYTDAPLPAEATAGLGESYQMMSVSIKPYACCRYNHGLIDCMLRLRISIPDLDGIEEIRLGVLRGGALLVAEPIERKRAPENVVDAQFSAPFAAAVALAHGSAGLSDYTEKSLQEPLIRRLMARTTCYTDPELDAVYPAQWPAAASIRLRSGEVLAARQPFPLGEPQNPVSREALQAKFREMVAASWADQALDLARRLPQGSLSGLLTLFRRRPD